MPMKWKVLLMTILLMGVLLTSLAFTLGRKARAGLIPEHQPKLMAARAMNAAPSPLDVQENPKDGLKYIRIPAGTFMMGCSPGDEECQPDEKPPHEVTITKDFWIGQTEVTVGAYKRFIAATGREIHAAPSFNPDWTNENLPIVSVTWDEARDYCVWAGGRLPSEAEWEYRGARRQHPSTLWKPRRRSPLSSPLWKPTPRGRAETPQRFRAVRRIGKRFRMGERLVR